MTLELADLSTATFNTTRAADSICSDLTRKAGWPHRYVAARLAIARSLSLPALPPPLTDEECDDKATPLRGMQLFGEGIDPAAWLSLIVQRASDRTMTKRSFRALVSAHWKRGAELLKNDWERTEGDMAGFVERLAELANFPVDVEKGVGKSAGAEAPVVSGAVQLSIGEAGRDTRTGEQVTFALNGAGGSPHMAVMGGVGSGKLTQFGLFVPQSSPAEFFSRSWIIRLPQDGSEEMRRLIVNLTLNALDGWLNAQPDAPADEQGIRTLRHVTLLDEAHVILRTRLPALANLVRMSRSKGGVVMLVSQSSDDFEAADDGYLDNMGLTLAFNTQAKPGPTRRIFGDGHTLTGLNVGEALCRIRSEAKTRRVVAWEP